MSEHLPPPALTVINSEAACFGTGPSLPFFALEDEELNQTVTRDYDAQRKLCYGCSQRFQCAVDAVTLRDQSTIRAGFLTWLPQERTRLLEYLKGNDRP